MKNFGNESAKNSTEGSVSSLRENVETIASYVYIKVEHALQRIFKTTYHEVTSTPTLRTPSENIQIPSKADLKTVSDEIFDLSSPERQKLSPIAEEWFNKKIRINDDETYDVNLQHELYSRIFTRTQQETNLFDNKKELGILPFVEQLYTGSSQPERKGLSHKEALAYNRGRIRINGVRLLLQSRLTGHSDGIFLPHINSIAMREAPKPPDIAIVNFRNGNIPDFVQTLTHEFGHSFYPKGEEYEDQNLDEALASIAEEPHKGTEATLTNYFEGNNIRHPEDYRNMELEQFRNAHQILRSLFLLGYSVPALGELLRSNPTYCQWDSESNSYSRLENHLENLLFTSGLSQEDLEIISYYTNLKHMRDSEKLKVIFTEEVEKMAVIDNTRI
jgi:hypothetical protein